MFQYEWFGGQALPTGREGVLKAGANIGAVVGQFLFGYLGDALGRSESFIWHSFFRVKAK
jgi:MFS transporter, PHS family, inorganic phosphate transporter